jgi:hypothetical protein
VGDWNSYFDAPLLTALLHAAGVPPIDHAEQLYNNTFNMPINATAFTPIVDASTFNSMSLDVSEVNGVAGSCAQPRRVYVWAYADLGGTQFMCGDVYAYMPSGGGLLITPAMLRGPFIQIEFGPVAVGAANSTISVTLTGSIRTTGTQARVEMYNPQVGGYLGAGFTSATADGDPGVWSATGAWPPGNNEEWPCTYAGNSTFGWDVGALTNASFMRIYDIESGTIISALSYPVSTTTQRGFNIMTMPCTPVRFRFANSCAGNVTCTFSLVMDGNR